jgi:hypothetical protein
MRPINNNIAIFSDAEYAALYEIPEFDNSQQIEYLTLTDDELIFVMKRKTLAYQVACIIQLGYFKAMQIFFQFEWEKVSISDINFIIQQYFSGQTLEPQVLTIIF